MKFTMPRDVQVVTTFGHVLAFKKNEPQEVPTFLHQAVISKGGVPEDDIDVPEPKGIVEPSDPAEREAAYFKVFAVIATANKTADFTSGGTPSVKAVSRELGWDADGKEVADSWKKFKAGPATA